MGGLVGESILQSGIDVSEEVLSAVDHIKRGDRMGSVRHLLRAMGMISRLVFELVKAE